MSPSFRPGRTATAAAASALTALALAACSGSSDSRDPSGSAGPTDDGAMTGAARIVIGLDSDQAALGYDPVRYGSGQRFFFEGLYDSLFVLGADGSVQPSLVTAFTYNEDQTELTLDLDTSATFADGSTLSADLVKQNLDARGDADLSAYAEMVPGGEAGIEEVTVVDEDTVTLTFAAPMPGYEANLVMPAGAIVGADGAADRDSLDAAPDGSGPLELDADATIKGNTYLLVKKESDARAADYPFDEYEFRPILDGQARANAVISGDVDIAFLAADTTAQVESSGVPIATNGGTVVNLLPFDKNGSVTPAFGEEKVRQAMSVAIDRATYVAGVHPGQVPTVNALPADSPGYDPALETTYAYDPDHAKELLAEAGYADGVDFTVTVSPDSQRDWEALQPYLAAVGFNATLQNASSTEELFAAVQTQPMGGPIPLTWTNPAGNVFGVMLGFANFHGAENGALMGAMGALGEAQDDAARAEALAALNHAIVDTGWLIPLYEQVSPWGYDDTKVAEPTFVGAEPFPILATLTPAS